MNTNNEIIETIKQNLNESISKIKSLDCINNYNKNNYMNTIKKLLGYVNLERIIICLNSEYYCKTYYIKFIYI